MGPESYPSVLGGGHAARGSNCEAIVCYRRLPVPNVIHLVSLFIFLFTMVPIYSLCHSGTRL
jgi:hypothetical protein